MKRNRQTNSSNWYSTIRYCLFFIILAGATACHKEDIPEPEPEPVKEARSLFFYMIADNNLNDDIRMNLVDIYNGMKQYDEKATVLIYWDGGDNDPYWNTPVILRMTTEGDGWVNGLKKPEATDDEVYNAMDVVATLPQQVSTDPEVLTAMLQQMKGFTKADNYGLIISSHGSGWLNTITPRGKSIGMDELQSNTLQIPDLRDALAASGIHFDFLLFDACLMGCAEVCYDLREVIDYCIASPTDVPAPGFPYEEMLSHLIGDVNGYKEACRIFIDKYKASDDTSIHLGTISLIDCREMGQLAAEVNRCLTANPEKAQSIPVWDIQQYAGKSSSFKYLSSDIRQYIEALNDGVVPVSFDAQLDKTVLFKDYVPDSYWFPINGEHYCGLGMFLPYGSLKPRWVNYFYTLDWSSAAGWESLREM